MIGTTPVAGWKRVRFNLADPLQVSPALLPGDTITSITLVLDQGPAQIRRPLAACCHRQHRHQRDVSRKGPYSSTGE